MNTLVFWDRAMEIGATSEHFSKVYLHTAVWTAILYIGPDPILQQLSVAISEARDGEIGHLCCRERAEALARVLNYMASEL